MKPLREGEVKLKGNGRTVPPLAAIKTPLRDGDTERPDDPAYANSYFVNANSTTAPGTGCWLPTYLNVPRFIAVSTVERVSISMLF